MQMALFVLVAVLLACVQHGRLAFWPLAPDLPLALAAWAMVDGDDDGVVLRSWIVGLCRDLVDPGVRYGGECFYTITYTCLGLLYMPMRAWLFRSRAIAWGGWAWVCSLAISLIDGRLGSVHQGLPAMLAVAVLTACAAMGLGWLLGGLPPALRPIRAGGA